MAALPKRDQRRDQRRDKLLPMVNACAARPDRLVPLQQAGRSQKVHAAGRPHEGEGLGFHRRLSDLSL